MDSTFKKIQLYAQLLSAIKGKLTPHQKNWEEYGLKVYAKGLTTTPIPVKKGSGIEALDLNLNFVEHKLKVFCADKRESVELVQPELFAFTTELIAKFNSLGIDYSPEEKFYSTEKLDYAPVSAEMFWEKLRPLYFMFQEFKGTILYETSGINFWAHHFDLSMLVFSGGLIEGKDPTDWDNSREQMNFGFSFDPSGIGSPYFYITFYPFKEKYQKIELPEFAVWNTDGWKGVLIRFGDEQKINIPLTDVLMFLKSLVNYFR